MRNPVSNPLGAGNDGEDKKQSKIMSESLPLFKAVQVSIVWSLLIVR